MSGLSDKSYKEELFEAIKNEILDLVDDDNEWVESKTMPGSWFACKRVIGLGVIRLYFSIDDSGGKDYLDRKVY